MSYFSYSDNEFFGSSNNNTSIECIKCSDEPEYMRCKCCNEVVTIVDIIKHESKNGIKINLVKFNGMGCIKILGKDLQKIIKYIRNGKSTVDGVDFDYKPNYITSKTIDGKEQKVINNIEITNINETFKPDNINIKYLLMCNFPYKSNERTNDTQPVSATFLGNVLIDIRKLNVKVPEGLF